MKHNATPRERKKAKRMEHRPAVTPRRIRCPECGKPAILVPSSVMGVTGMARCPRGHIFKWEDAA